MTSPNYSFFSKQSDSSPTSIQGIDIAFVGESIDERGSATTEAVKASASSVFQLNYCPEKQILHIDGEVTRLQRLAERMANAHRILVDSTTVGLGEILSVLTAAKSGRHTQIEFLYAEPKDYTKSAPESVEEPQHRTFTLTRNCRFQGIQGFAHQHQPHMPATHVLMLGFEPARIRNAIEQRGDINRENYKLHAVIGVPAFQAGWEGNTIRTHLDVLEEQGIAGPSITYCPANSVREAYLTLWDLYQQLGDERKVFFVSPLGTKPHTIAATLFLLETKGLDMTTSLYYDHPVRINERSSGYSTWHHITVDIAD